SRRRHTSFSRDWSSDVCSSDLPSRAKASGAYINSALAKTEALLNGYDEAIVLGADGQVSEASAANLFIVRGGTLITPPVTSDVQIGRASCRERGEVSGLGCSTK